MGKFLALLCIGGGFICLILFYHGPTHVEQPVVNVESTVSIDQHISVVCDQAVTEQFGESFEQHELAVKYCSNALKDSYSILDHWPGPEMNGNNSEAFFAANKAAVWWGELLDVPYGYFASDGRDVIMKFMKIERETYGL